ncbi:MAG: hypothetical protein ACWGOW_00110 [Gammaproteobacteria bacterium]
MRKYIVLLSLCLVIPVQGVAQDQDVEMAAMAFFDATRTGSVDQIRTLIAGPLLDNTRVLLTENEKYPDYLRERYVGATAEIASISTLPDGDVLVDMAITFQNLSRSIIQLRMSQDQGGGWKVVEQSQIY